jgi:HK97 family phage portal protein
MSIINRIKQTVFPTIKPAGRNGTIIHNLFGQHEVTTENALELSDILTCVRVLAESVASLPLCLYERSTDGGFKSYDHPLFELMRYQPNSMMTSYDLRLWMMIDALIRGNGVAQVIRNGQGKVVELHPLYASKIGYHFMDDGTLHYDYPDPDNDGERIMLPQNEVLHIKIFSSGHLLSPSLIELSEDLLNGGKGAEEYTREFFKNGAVLSGFIEYPDEMDEETFQRLKADWTDAYTGKGNRHKTPILEGGAKFTPLNLNHAESQMLESRKYTRSQIAGLFRVPAHLINDLEKATFSNIEHQDLAFVKHTLRPLLCNWEQRLRLTLLSDNEKAQYYFKHDTNDLLRGDLPSRFTAYSQAIQNGIMSPNDVRRKEDEPTYEGGDTYFVNGALMPVDSAKEVEAVNKNLSRPENLINKTYSDYPEGATNNAKRALKYKKENGSTCGTNVGWTRANQLANREALSRDTIARMASFKRHQQNKDVPYSEGCGGLMWDCWGGDAGINWAIRKLKEIDKKD